MSDFTLHVFSFFLIFLQAAVMVFIDDLRFSLNSPDNLRSIAEKYIKSAQEKENHAQRK